MGSPPADLTLGDVGVAPTFLAGVLLTALIKAMENIGEQTGVHAETLTVCVGAIAGQCATNMVWETRVALGATPRQAGLTEVQGASGEVFFTGDILDQCLVPQTDTKVSLWQCVAHSAVALGIPYEELPDYRDLFAHVSAGLTGPDFGVIQVPPANRPGMKTQDALRLAWPLARHLLTEQMQGKLKPSSGALAQYWPTIANLAAGQLIAKTKDVVDPRISVQLLMESAIAASRIDPRTVPQTVHLQT